MTWIKALHLKQWADTGAAKGLLPLLLRRLIRGIVPRDAIVNFPALEQNHRPGFDGVVNTSVSNQFIPDFNTVWEMSVEHEPKNKADIDFAKRCKSTSENTRRNTTFVFVTPREWQKKDEWTSKQNDKRLWKSVVAYDCNDIEHWLELCPHVDAWFAMELGHRPEGVIDLTSYWKALQGIARFSLKECVFFAGREYAKTELADWINGDPTSALLYSASSVDSLDFLAAFVNTTEESTRPRILAVETLAAWRKLSNVQESILLVASDRVELTPEDISNAVSRGHHVLVAGQRSSAHLTRHIQLPRLDCYLLQDALRNSGFDEVEAHSKAYSCCGSTAILKRLIGTHPSQHFPSWAREEVCSELAPFVLVGGWEKSKDIPKVNFPFPRVEYSDAMIVEELLGVNEEELEKHIVRWSSEDPLFLRFRDSIVVTSREDSWHLLAPALTQSIVEKFEELAVLCLDENDPGLDLEPSNRWLANIHGKVHSISNELRSGIIETLTLMSVVPIAKKSIFEIDFSQVCRRVLEKVLPENASWERWASLDGYLPMFAEMDPEFLLSRIESDLRASDRQLPTLFEQCSTSVGSSAVHCGLVWALEKMAWSPRYLTRVAMAFARLSAYEESLPHNYGNRPSNSFQEIFSTWNRQTNASDRECIDVLKKVVSEGGSDLTEGWNLVLSLLSPMPSSTPTPLPQWRTWADGAETLRSQRNDQQYENELTTLLMDAAGNSVARWALLVESIMFWGRACANDGLKRLDILTSASQYTGEFSVLWRALDLIVRSQPLNSDKLDSEPSLRQMWNQLVAIRDRIEPTNNIVRSQWLFGHDVVIPGVDQVENFDEYLAQLNVLRTNAIQLISSESSWTGIRELASLAQDVHTIGWILAREELLNMSKALLQELASSPNHHDRFLAASYVSYSFQRDGTVFLESTFPEAGSSELQANILGVLPTVMETWQWIDENVTHDVANRYWKAIRFFMRDEDVNHLPYVVDKLMQVARPWSAVSIAWHVSRKSALTDEYLASMLESCLSIASPIEQCNSSMAYAARELFKRLQVSDFPRQRLAQLEWNYLPILCDRNSTCSPKALKQSIVDMPDLYVELIRQIYRGASEVASTVQVALDRQRSVHARRLLENFDVIPGSSSNGIDASILTDWVKRVRDEVSKTGHLNSADVHIGELFGKFRMTEPKHWPPEAICRVLEDSNSQNMFRGFRNSLCNGRGITSRNRTDGGKLERDEASLYRESANHLQNYFPFVADCLRKLVELYEEEGKREDAEAERTKLGR